MLRAEPNLGRPALGGTVQLIATVRDASGNGLAGVPVTFSTTAGQISPATVTTERNGEATSLTTSRRDGHGEAGDSRPTARRRGRAVIPATAEAITVSHRQRQPANR